MTRSYRKIREFPEEDLHPDQATRHKSHIEKVMFLVAVGVPQTRPDGTWFDGKLGIWPVVERTIAQRTSANGPAGAEVIQNLSLDF